MSLLLLGCGSVGVAAVPASNISQVKAIGTAHTTGTATSTRTITIPAGGVAIGNVITVVGVANADRTLTVTDSKGNTWATRGDVVNGSLNSWLADARVTVALVSGDTITCTVNGSSHMAFAAVEWTGMATTGWFDKNAGGTYADANGTGGAITPANDYSLILGVFGHTNDGTITTPGSGFADLTGDTSVTTVRTIDWEYKTQGVLAAVTATATIGPNVPAVGAGITAAYKTS